MKPRTVKQIAYDLEFFHYALLGAADEIRLLTNRIDSYRRKIETLNTELSAVMLANPLDAESAYKAVQDFTERWRKGETKNV